MAHLKYRVYAANPAVLEAIAKRMVPLGTIQPRKGTGVQKTFAIIVHEMNAKAFDEVTSQLKRSGDVIRVTTEDMK